MDFESLNFNYFGLDDSFLEEENSSEYSNFYFSSYYGFQKLKGKLMNVELSLENKGWIKIHNYDDIIYAVID